MTTVLVVGGGIAGWCAAWFATRRGASVTLIDAGVDRASDLPVALVNPVRGREGRVVARGIEGMHATFALVDELVVEGHAIAHGRGLYRPLFDPAPDRDAWESRLPRELRRRWHEHAPRSLGLAADVPALEWLDAGWLVPRGLLDALARCGARALDGEVVAVDATSATLASGERLVADHVVWCGGAWGASRLDRSPHPAHLAPLANDDGHYRPGGLGLVAGRPTSEALAFGTYAVPLDASTVVGPTSEASRGAYPGVTPLDEGIAALTADLAVAFDSPHEVDPLWRGVRLSRLSTRARTSLVGVRTITALGSRGFLMAPLLAAEWAASL